MSNYENKIYLITGASSGMGRDTALYLASKNVKALTLFSRGKDRLQEVADQISKEHPRTKTLIVAGDAASAEDNKRAVDETVAAFGGIHGAFVNAGAYRGGAMIPEVSDKDIDDILDINVKGVIYAMRYLIPAIKATIGDDKNTNATGSIVVNSSAMATAIVGPKSAGSSIYSASKAFVNSLVETAAIENAPTIRVNGVMPGVVQTGIMPVDDATYQHIGAALQPLWGRPGKSREVSALVAFLLSDEASFISGTNIKADGLWSLSGGGM
mmetsp:Transcript_27626/g.77405  ORF Transcript_27626/g.77405 Transcript_27626/m.77405 type:complete len:269 (+) Transcript_27626:1403-2209(+)